MKNNILIAYYSHSGNTKKIAQLISKETGGDVLEIRPQTPYPQDYDAVVEQAQQEIRAGFRPLLAEATGSLEQYDMVFIGSPNWWSTIAPPVATFLENTDLAEKTVIPFCTHGGGGLARLAQDTEKLCPQSVLLNAFCVYGNGSAKAHEEVSAWLRDIGVLQEG
ncbi:MAG: flavodoxin [Christensenella sp.]|uniref:flavodoxin n=1 Tax=Christensenella sp. TaxID=1935934 RepID=UPI002B20FE2A|nr:flavodoxin [Christensenella sp.]MEA5002165.1 flavodoxin [Christensenella sp.]